MNAMTPVAVFFHDLFGEQAAIAQAVELTHDHAPFGATVVGGVQYYASSITLSDTETSSATPRAALWRASQRPCLRNCRGQARPAQP